MARIRTIKPEFFKHLELQELECSTPGQNVMLVYAGLWTQCDKNGVFFYNIKVIKNEILPFLEFDMKKTMDILESNKYFIRFKHGNREYGYIPNFSKYQFPTKGEKDSPAKYPDPPIMNSTENIPEDVLGDVSDIVPENIPEAEGLKDKRNKEEGKRIPPQGGESCFSLSENQEKPEPLPDKPSTSKEDATTVFQKARVLWNERQLKPECRDLIIPPLHYDCLPTFQNYSWLEIENAIKNYHWHKTGKCGDGWAQPPPYGSIYGFLKTGVSRYFDDDALQSQFKERINGS